jgi:hypothetical protein
MSCCSPPGTTGAIALLPIPLETVTKKRDLLEGYGFGVKLGGKGAPSAEGTERCDTKVAISAQSMRVLQ